jgi:virulence factor
MQTIRIGLVDFDTSHVEAFTQRLNHLDIAESEWVTGEREAKVVAGWPGDSRIMPERIPGYTEKLRDYGIEIVEKPTDLLGNIDAVMVTSQQGARHLERATPFLQAGIPTFVDKPFAGNVQEAEAMIALAEKYQTPLMSCSSLRYDPQVQAALAQQETMGKILSVDVWGPCALHEGNPGLLHYGIHGVEMLFALLGTETETGWQEVQTHRTPEGEVITALWSSGHVSTLRGIRAGSYGFGFVAHYEKGNVPFVINGTAFYREMLKAIVAMFTTKTPPIPYAEMREIMAFIEAADTSAQEKIRVIKQ